MDRKQTIPYLITFILFITIVIGCYANRDIIIPAVSVAKTEVKAQTAASQAHPVVLTESFSEIN
jgi:hypothetical protein